jgi:hypothetical protein
MFKYPEHLMFSINKERGFIKIKKVHITYSMFGSFYLLLWTHKHL